MGKFFEDFELGEETLTSGRTITEADLVNFACVSGDWNEIHTNKEFAASGPFGQRIAHGAFVFSVATGLTIRLGVTADTLIAFYGFDRLRFINPTFIGDTIKVRSRVQEKIERDKQGGAIATLNEVINQRGEVVVSYVARTLIKRRPE